MVNHIELFATVNKHQIRYIIIIQVLRKRWNTNSNAFNPLDLQFTDLQHVDVLPGNPTYDKSTRD